jgi:integrase
MAKIVKGEERGRPGKWIVDYRDASGKRKWITVDTQAQAKEELRKVLTDTSTGYCSVDPDITLGEYGDKVIAAREGFVKARTVQANREGFTRIKDFIGNVKVKAVTPGVVVKLAQYLKSKKLANGTVRYALEVLSIILNHARIDGIIVSNPAFGITKQLRLEKEKELDDIKAFTLDQRIKFIEAARTNYLYPLFRFLFATGVRVGEALAIRIDDLDVQGKKVRIDEQCGSGETTSPKSNKTRYVDVTAEVIGLLQQQIKRTKEKELAHGRQASYLFVTEAGKPVLRSVVYKQFERVLVLAGLPAHFHPHCTRHTYATLLLSNGESLQYVQQQLGHATISLTADLYGKWIPLKSSGVQERIEGGSKEIARTAIAG